MQTRYVQLLKLDPSLGAGLDRADREEAQRLAVARLVTVAPGHWTSEELAEQLGRTSSFGCLVADGVIARDLVLDGRIATQLLGKGDLLALGYQPSAAIGAVRIFGVADPVRLALLDETFVAVVGRWPAIAAALLVRAGQQLERAALQQAISQMPRSEQRIVALFWHLAERWGTALDGHVALPLSVGHEAIGRLVGGRRSTISAALGRLADRELIVRRDDNTWLLAPESRALLNTTPYPSPTPDIRVPGASSGTYQAPVSPAKREDAAPSMSAR